jgi:hypothetical protein
LTERTNAVVDQRGTFVSNINHKHLSRISKRKGIGRNKTQTDHVIPSTSQSLNNLSHPYSLTRALRLPFKPRFSIFLATQKSLCVDAKAL